MATTTGNSRFSQTSTGQSGPAPVLIGRSITDFARPKSGDVTELIRDRFLCRGGSVLLCGGTGLGKSSLTVQLPMQFALGLGDFGIQPTRPLSSLVIQAENDDGDIAEFRDGAFSGYGYTPDQIGQAAAGLAVHTETRHRGQMFCTQVLRPLLDYHRPDLVFLDHALAYLGGDASAQTEVGRFLREYLQPILIEYRIGCFILHHTPKPISRTTYSDKDFSYLGMGSVEWANWARGVLTLVNVAPGIFELRAPKRGERLGWLNDKGEKTTHRFIAWSADKIFWRKPLPSEVPKVGRPKAPAVDPQELLNALIYSCTAGAASHKVWFERGRSDFGWTDKGMKEARSILVKENRVWYDESRRVWCPK